VLVSDLLSAHTPAALRLLLLRRPWIESWNFEAAELAVVENELESLFSVSARPAKGASAGTAAQDAVLSALRDDIDVRAALEIALDEGGPAARTVIEILGLR
jgi:cysteinyl-tRNA synthetase